MSLLKFELKKMLKQKKYVWLILVTFLVTSALFSMNLYQRSRLQGQWARYGAFADIAPYTTEWNMREWPLVMLRDQGRLTEAQAKQLEYTQEMAEHLQRMRLTINYGLWEDFSRFEKQFLDVLQGYAEAGGEFTSLDGMDREIAIAKNAWMLEHDVAFEYEGAPLTPHLFLKESSTLLLGIMGIAILLVLFGNSITEEKEHSTWKTINTQPISKLKLILSKYIVFLLITIIFTSIYLGLGVGIPKIVEGLQLDLQYPQILTSTDSFMIISTGDYLLRAIVLFFCASSFTFSASLLASKWVKKSMTSYVLVGTVLGIGYATTSFIKSSLNPFYLLSFQEILNKIPQSNDWIYIVSAVIWTLLLLGLTVCLPDQEIKTVQVIEKKVLEWINTKKQFAGGKTSLKNKLIWNLRLFEWRKVRRESLLKTFAITMLVLIVAGHFFVTYLTEEKRIQYFLELEWRTSVMQEKVIEQEQIIEEFYEEVRRLEQIVPPGLVEEFSNYPYEVQFDPENNFNILINFERIREELEGHLAILVRNLESSENAIKAYEQGDWETFHEYQISVAQMSIDGFSPAGSMIRPQVSTFTEEISIAEKQWLIERGIQPVLSGEFIPNIHQYWGRNTVRIGWGDEEVRQEQFESQNNKVDNSGLYYLYLSFTNSAYYLPIILLVFFVGGGLAKEKGKKATYKLLKVQPISDDAIYIGKLINTSIIALASAVAIPLVLVLVGTVLNRFGDWEFPILHYNSYRTTISSGYTGFKAGFGQGYHFITLGKYLLNSTMLLMSISLFCIALSNFISLFFKRTLSVAATTTIIAAGGYWLNARRILNISYRSPFTYFNIPKIVNGEYAARLNDPRINVQTGIFVLLFFTVLVVGAGYTYINREKIIAKIADLKNKRKVDNNGRVENDTIS